MSMGFPRQEYWSGLPSPSPGDHPDPGIEPRSSALAGGFFTTEPPGKASSTIFLCQKMSHVNSDPSLSKHCVKGTGGMLLVL